MSKQKQKQTEQEFVILAGRHIAADGKTYTKGNVISLKKEVADKFPGKFRAVGEVNLDSDEPSARALVSEQMELLQSQNEKLTKENALQKQQLEEANAKIAQLEHGDSDQPPQ